MQAFRKGWLGRSDFPAVAFVAAAVFPAVRVRGGVVGGDHIAVGGDGHKWTMISMMGDDGFCLL